MCVCVYRCVCVCVCVCVRVCVRARERISVEYLIGIKISAVVISCHADKINNVPLKDTTSLTPSLSLSHTHTHTHTYIYIYILCVCVCMCVCKLFLCQH